MAVCRVCGRHITKDEEGLTKKLVNRGTESFLCLTCLSSYFGVPEEMLREKIEQFRAMGCTLFN